MRYFNKKSGIKRWVWYVMLKDVGLAGLWGFLSQLDIIPLVYPL